MSVPANIREELVRLCSSGRTRKAEFSPKMPCHWNPWEAKDEDGQPLTSIAAWDAVHTTLLTDCVVTAIELDKPPGKTGYWFHMTDAAGQRIYVKLMIGSGVVFGRSFHIG